jgi:serine/threonine protein kinase
MLRILESELEFNGVRYQFTENRIGHAGVTFMLNRDGQRTVLKLSDEYFSEPDILPQLSQYRYAPRLLSSGQTMIESNGYKSVHYRNELLKPGLRYYVHLSYVPGCMLSDLMESPNYKSILLRLIDILYELNARGLCHNDVHTENIVISDDDIYLIDWSDSIRFDDHSNDLYAIVNLVIDYLQIHHPKTVKSAISELLTEEQGDLKSIRDNMTAIVHKYVSA